MSAQPLIRDVHFDALLANKAFDVDWLRAEMTQAGRDEVLRLVARHRDTSPMSGCG